MKSHFLPCVGLWAVLLTASVFAGQPPGSFAMVTGKLLQAATPRDFYLEGNAIPVERSHAALIKTPEGARALFALIVMAGFASQIQHKYLGMLISEGPLSICGRTTGVGSYGFGLHHPSKPGAGNARFVLYNQAGKPMIACDAKEDFALREPKPLQVVIKSSHSARLYFGRYWLELGP